MILSLFGPIYFFGDYTNTKNNVYIRRLGSGVREILSLFMEEAPFFCCFFGGLLRKV
jgi:hypothetical protein